MADKGSNRRLMAAAWNAQADKEKNKLFTFLTGKQRTLENVAHGTSLYSKNANRADAPNVTRDMYAEEAARKGIKAKEEEFNISDYDINLSGAKKKPKPVKSSAQAVSNKSMPAEESVSKKTLLGS